MRKAFLILATWSVSVFALAEPGVIINVKLSPAGSFKGETKEVKGHAVLNGNEITAENIVVELKNLNSGIKLRDDHMKNKYLDIKKFPEAILISAKGKDGKGDGIIKIKGIEKPISGVYKIKNNEVEAQFDLKLSDFGISGIKYMGIGVGDIVKVTVDIPVKKGSPVAPQKAEAAPQRSGASLRPPPMPAAHPAQNPSARPVVDPARKR